MKKICEEDFLSLVKQVDHDLSEFYSVFTSVLWDPSNGAFHRVATGVFQADIAFYKEFNVIKSSITIRLCLTFQQFLYRISVSSINSMSYEHTLYKKEYSYLEIMTEQDKIDIINTIGNHLNRFIETHGFTNKML